MSKREPYSYVVLRYLHDVMRDEFVNVGLVTVFPGRPLFLGRAQQAVGRVKGVFPDLENASYRRTMGAVNRGMRQVGQEVGAGEAGGDGWSALDYAKLVVPLDDSALQWSSPGCGVSEDPERTFEELYRGFVTRYDRTSQRHRSDNEVWRPVARTLKRRNVVAELAPKRFEGRTDSVEFRHALKNGLWHAYEPVSFDLAGADGIKDKARRWLGNLVAVRDDIPRGCQVHFIVGRPRKPSLSDAYGNALEILRQVPFENDVFEDDQIDRVVDQIEAVSRRG